MASAFLSSFISNPLISSISQHRPSRLSTPSDANFYRRPLPNFQHPFPAFQIRTSSLLLPFRVTSQPSILTPLNAFLGGGGGSSSAQLDEHLQLVNPSVALEDEQDNNNPAKTLLWVLFWASVSLAVFAVSKDAEAAVTAAADSIRASKVGVKVASALRSSGWPDEAIIFALATLPVIELRGAIPVGYWMMLKPVALTVLSVLGNMVPVPFILLYLKKLADYFTRGNNNSPTSQLVTRLLNKAREKAGPVEEFQALGLMLFVAVPFPGTGAWSGAIIASILDMPFWSALLANFFGVVIAGLLVNLLVNLGIKYAVVAGVVLFFVSSYMWSVLRSFRRPKGVDELKEFD